MEEENQSQGLSLDEKLKRIQELEQELGVESTEQLTEQPTEQPEVSTDTTVASPKEDKRPDVQPGEVIPGTWGMGIRKPRPGVAGFFHDVGQNMWQDLAPAVGVSDTLIDFINFASAGDQYNIPKLPSYENKASQAVRNISGLVLPSLGLRGMMMKAGAKVHAAKTAAPWLQKLGNNKTFEYIARGGIDFSSGGIVDYVAEQNQANDTFLTQMSNFWPATKAYIPDYMLTGPDKTADQIRFANVAEGGIFNIFAGILEGAAYVGSNMRSLKRTARFIPTDGQNAKALNEAGNEASANIKFSEQPIENAVLKKTHEKQEALKELGEYYRTKGELPDEPTVGLHDVFETTEDYVIPVTEANPLLRAQVNAADIAYDVESSWGRINRIVSEAGRKNGIEFDNLMNRTLVVETTEKLKKGGSFKYKTNTGKIITEKMIKDAGDHLAATLLHPRVDKEDILGILREFKESVDGSITRIVGKKGINKALKDLQSQMVDLDAYKARAYLVTSEAGQISDMAEGIRLMDDQASLQRTVELMADRLEVLMVEKGLANFEAGTMLQNMDAWKKAVATGDKEVIEQAAAVLVDHNKSALLDIIPDAKEWAQTIKTVSRENPEFLKPLLMASELADGDVDSLFKLHKWAQENLGIWQKMIYDGNPAVPSIINKAIMSNLFNSMLSAPTTPIAAGIGNLTGLFGKSQAQIWGAVVSGDFGAAKRAMTAWYSLDDTLQKAFNHMRLVFRKAATNPKDISYTMRSDIALKESQGIGALRAYGDAAATKGEYGANGLLRIHDDLEDMAKDPLLRWGSNSMSGLDGFSKSVLASSEAKYRALWKATQEGTELTDEAFKKAHEEVYNSFFDSNGMLSNQAIDANAREIALNADSPMVDLMNNMIRQYPIIRSIVWFPRTTANVLDTFTKWSPAGQFSSDWLELFGRFGTKSIDEFDDPAIIQILTKRGKPVDEYFRETFKTLRHEVRGKAAISGILTTSAVMAGINDRCTGTGHINKAIQSKRNKLGWKKKSCKVPGTDQVISYEWMGPIGEWLSLAIDLGDNADTLSTGQFENFMQMIWTIGAANFSDKQVLTQLEPLFDVMQGNGAAAVRWQSNLLNNMLPMGSARQWAGKMMYPELREVRTRLDDALRNKNAWLDMFDPSRKLPAVVDPVDGKPVNDLSWYQRLSKNAVKLNDQPSPTNQWLIDIEYTGSSAMNLSNRGALLEKPEIEAINSIIGKQGYYKEELSKIKQRAENLSYTDETGVTYKGFREILRAARKGNVSSEILNTKKYAGIFDDITSAYNDSKRLAEDTLRDGNETEKLMWANIQAREFRLLNRKFNTEIGDLDTLYNDEKTPMEETLEMFK
tara:strand:- start:431 stop:4474 length:4044 start_codon:yes stop_codon:yes gene_type:complete